MEKISRSAPFPVLLHCLGLGLGYKGVSTSLQGKESCVLLFLRGKKEVKRFPRYPCQVILGITLA